MTKISGRKLHAAQDFFSFSFWLLAFAFSLHLASSEEKAIMF